jgi:hypothetical protein
VLALVVRQAQSARRLVDRDGSGVPGPPHFPEVIYSHLDMSKFGLAGHVQNNGPAVHLRVVLVGKFVLEEDQGITGAAMGNGIEGAAGFTGCTGCAF